MIVDYSKPDPIGQMVPQIMGRCRHFNGLSGGAKGLAAISRGEKRKCEAGIAYDDVRKQGVRMVVLPCWKPGADDRDNPPKDGVWPTCDKCSFPTEAEARAEAEEDERWHRASMERFTVVMPAIEKHSGGKRGVAGEMPCPSCKTGTLRYSVSGYNGHVHAKCSTDNCVSFMQ